MSENFETIKKYYDLRFWTEEKVKNAVIKGKITAKEFKDIVGKEYIN